MVCPECGAVHQTWNICRDRHCPNCQSAREVYDTLFSAAWETVKTFGERQESRMGMTALLHMWGSNLSFHPRRVLPTTVGGVCQAADMRSRQDSGVHLAVRLPRRYQQQPHQ